MKKKVITVKIFSLSLCYIAAMSIILLNPIHVQMVKAKSTKKSYPVCNVSTCKKTKVHKHKGTSYASHSKNDGHSYHLSVCSVTSCTKTGNHKHGGVTYSAHHNGDGHDYHDPIVCSVTSCTKTGDHIHNGVTYSAHHNADGHSYHDSSSSHHNSNGHH